MGFLGSWLVVAMLFAVVIPDGSYLFEWPLIAALAAWIWIFVRHPRSTSSAMLVLIASAAMALVLGSSEVVLSYISIGARSLSDLPPLVVLFAALWASAWRLAPNSETPDRRQPSDRRTPSRTGRDRDVRR
jgi:hypothetical protein